jgi:hypothetical protein
MTRTGSGSNVTPRVFGSALISRALAFVTRDERGTNRLLNVIDAAAVL